MLVTICRLVSVAGALAIGKGPIGQPSETSQRPAEAFQRLTKITAGEFQIRVVIILADCAARSKAFIAMDPLRTQHVVHIVYHMSVPMAVDERTDCSCKSRTNRSVFSIGFA